MASYVLLYFLAVTPGISKGFDVKFTAYSELVGWFVVVCNKNNIPRILRAPVAKCLQNCNFCSRLVNNAKEWVPFSSQVAWWSSLQSVLKKKSNNVALYSYCKSCYVFNIWYRCFYFYISRYCTALLKAVGFIDLNPLGACVAEKQQSDEKPSKSEKKQSLIMR